jgi:hypothetical protein
MQDNIIKLINEAIGENIETESLFPIDDEDTECRKEYAVRFAHNQALADLRSKTPELAKKIMDEIKELEEKAWKYDQLNK